MCNLTVRCNNAVSYRGVHDQVLSDIKQNDGALRLIFCFCLENREVLSLVC